MSARPPGSPSPGGTTALRGFQAVLHPGPASRRADVVDAAGVCRAFGARFVLRDVDLSVPAGRIHALLGPNGAGKTTLLRIVAGLIRPSAGTVRVLGRAADDPTNRSRIGWVPSSDRTFYLRLSGVENLCFFARMHGLRRGEARARSIAAMEKVGLDDVVHERVGHYSHGMQKRLSFARALLTEPALLLVDEATHDLDPLGSRTVRELAAGLASTGVGVLWATQRIDEMRDLAERVTVLAGGVVRFEGSVGELAAVDTSRRFEVHLADGCVGSALLEKARRAVGELGEVSAVANAPSRFTVDLGPGVVLGAALARLTASDVDVLSCREQSSDVERAVIRLTST